MLFSVVCTVRHLEDCQRLILIPNESDYFRLNLEKLFSVFLLRVTHFLLRVALFRFVRGLLQRWLPLHNKLKLQVLRWYWSGAPALRPWGGRALSLLAIFNGFDFLLFEVLLPLFVEEWLVKRPFRLSHIYYFYFTTWLLVDFVESFVESSALASLVNTRLVPLLQCTNSYLLLRLLSVEVSEAFALPPCLKPRTLLAAAVFAFLRRRHDDLGLLNEKRVVLEVCLECLHCIWIQTND